MPEWVKRLDNAQRERRVLGIPLAVVYKFFDDQSNYLAAVIAYYAFIAIFPQLLIATSVLGFLLQDQPDLRDTLIESALAQFPIVGTRLGQPNGIQGSVTAIVVGSLTAMYGALLLAQATQSAANVVWAVPQNTRLDPFRSRLRGTLLMTLAGIGVLVVAILVSLTTNLGVLASWDGVTTSLALNVASVVVTTAALSVLLSWSTAERRSIRSNLPGAFTIAVLWQALQAAGSTYVSSVVNRASEMNGIFALVLGLMVLLYFAAIIAVLGMQVNVVLAKRLYPRALLTPFTDNVELTEADRRAYTDYAKAHRHKGFEEIHVSFNRSEETEDRNESKAGS